MNSTKPKATSWPSGKEKTCWALSGKTSSEYSHITSPAPGFLWVIIYIVKLIPLRRSCVSSLVISSGEATVNCCRSQKPLNWLRHRINLTSLGAAYETCCVCSNRLMNCSHLIFNGRRGDKNSRALIHTLRPRRVPYSPEVRLNLDSDLALSWKMLAIKT